MKSPQVSVLLPVHNGAAFLRAAVRSVLDQRFGDLELIVVDDASTDETPALLREWTDPRLRVLRRDASTGISDALNAGLAEVTAPYVARMDADDLCHPDRLSRQVAFLNRHPDIVLCGTWVWRLASDGRRQLQRMPVDDRHIRAAMAFDNPFVHPSVMMRAGALRRHDLRYDPRSVHVEDYDLWGRLLEVGQGANLAAPLLTYRVHAQSITSSSTAAMDRSALPILRRHLTQLGLVPTAEELSLHRLLCTNRLEMAGPAVDAVERAEAWLARLCQASGGSPAGRAVRDRAAFAWFSACYNLLSRGETLPARICRSPLFRGVAGGWRMPAILAWRRFRAA